MNSTEENKISTYQEIADKLQAGFRVYHHSNYWNQIDEVISIDMSKSEYRPTVVVIGNTGERTHCTDLFEKGDKNWFVA